MNLLFTVKGAECYGKATIPKPLFTLKCFSVEWWIEDNIWTKGSVVYVGKFG